MRHSLPLSRYNILHVYTKQFSHDAFTAKIQICNRDVLQEVKCKQQSQLFRITRHLRCQKRFRILGFSATSQSNRSCSLHCVCQIQAAKKSRSYKNKSWRKRTDSFSPSYSCVSSGFGSSEEQFLPWESRPAIFQYKEDKKKQLELW